MRQTVPAVPGKMGLLFFLLGKKSSKTGNSQEMLHSASWEVRFLTVPISSPTGLCPQHLPQFRLAGTGWVHRLLTTSPHGMLSLGVYSPVLYPGWAPECSNITAETHWPHFSLLSRVWGQDFWEFKHPPSQNQAESETAPTSFASAAGLTSSNSRSPGQYDVLRAIPWTYSTVCWPSLASTRQYGLPH